MSVQEHKAMADIGPLRVAVVTVSTSRSMDEDRSGDLLANRLETAGHYLAGRKLVNDDVDAIRNAVRELGSTNVQVVVLTGGTGLTARDVTPEALSSLFTREIPGFGELFRMLSYKDVGPAAMLSRATAGVVGSMLVFALPGSVKACDLAIEKLILPELEHMVSQIVRDQRQRQSLVPASMATPRPAGPRLSAGQVVGEDAAAPDPGEGGRWRAAIAAHSGRMEKGPPPPLPEPVARLASVTSTLDTAGERATLVLEDGRRLGLYGWPDLQRPTSKVIAVGDGGPLAEVVALHRHPGLSGTLVFGGLLADPLAASEISEKITGREPPTEEPLFAVSGDVVWLRRGERAVKWNGSKERDDGTCKQVLASLMMEWHTR